MATVLAKPAGQKWSTGIRTTARQKLFQQPPKDATAYPALQEAVNPHIESFDALLEKSRLLEAGLRDIGTKIILDNGSPSTEENAESTQTGLSRGRRNRLALRIRDVYLEKAVLPASNKYTTQNRDIFPAECRERHASYRGKFKCRLEYQINGGVWKDFIRELGSLPIMVKSNRCHLRNFSPFQLAHAKEETEELGGYFLVNGIEKLIRLLILQRRNFPMAMIRPSFTGKAKGYTKYGVLIRSVRPDETSITNTLHYLDDGNVTFRFSWRKNEYKIPVMLLLKALVETNDREIFEGLAGMAGSKASKDTFVTQRVELLLRTFKAINHHSKLSARSFLGERFRPVLALPEEMSDYDAGTEFLRKIVLVHLGNVEVTEAQDRDKFKLLLFMIRKLYTLAAGDCASDNPDAVSSQEILLPGFLYGMIIKEKFETMLSNILLGVRDWLLHAEVPDFTHGTFESDFLRKILVKVNEDIGSQMEYFLATGNLSSPSGLDLQQVSGFTVVAEKINFYRFISHFRMVHRGSFFQEMRTTTVRKLLPESWGFLCPVHTPDGAPCGLLNHLAHKCKIATSSVNVSALPKLLSEMGVTASGPLAVDQAVAVLIDGRILGFCSPKQALLISESLRYWKIQGTHNVPLELEIGHIPYQRGGQFPGLYISSQPARMYRPVRYLPLNKTDFIGPLEQPFMAIACTEADIEPLGATHVELKPTNILSILANQTPFSDFNQSPRNMYQCQMAKQTMGTPSTALRYRSDNKMYCLQTGQTPVVRPPLYNEYGLDNFPNGTNAVVAVISYTGYDMDDAMILNKFAHERGLAHGSIYKTKVIKLQETRSSKKATRLFGFAPGGFVSAKAQAILDTDGLPRIGTQIQEHDPICASYAVSHDSSRSANPANCYVNRDRITQLHRYDEPETCYVESVTLIGSESGNDPLQSVSIKFRIPRSPVIGDKFSSRHGQKGVCSQKWPAADMPFSESGIVPDIIINPHAFPSRMTIGMFVESLAGKAGALHGLAQDSTPWRFSEDEGDTASEYFGHQLRMAGYNYHGNEPMYSGITGREFAADIFVGVVFYQRLRHMVNDKFQVRTTGPVAPLTGQPIKGRSRGGGIRVGEMERDSLLAHGCAFLLQDRLLNCSDYRKEWICKECGSFLSIQSTVFAGTSRLKQQQLPGANGLPKAGGRSGSSLLSSAARHGTGIVRCRKCATRVEDVLAAEPNASFQRLADLASEEWEDGNGGKWIGGDETTVVPIPGVLRYLDVELAAMGVKMKFNVLP